MRICILGAGGLGSVLGGYLANSGAEVTLIARPAHVAAIQQNGLAIHGVRGEFLIRDNLTAVEHATEAKGHFDQLILATKSKDSETALAQSSDLLGRFDTVCSVQNSLVKHDTLAAWAGSERVLGCSIIEGGTLEAPGRVRNHMTVAVTAYFGELDGCVSSRAEALAAAFNKAGLPTKAVDHIQQVLWEKLTQIANASSWSVSTLIGNPRLFLTDAMMVREAAEHYVQIAKELLSVYAAMGYEPRNFFAPVSKLKELYENSFDEAVTNTMQLGKMLKKRGGTGRTSMHDDVMNGRKTEVDYIVKPFLEKARELGIPIPTVTACYRIIKVLDYYLK